MALKPIFFLIASLLVITTRVLSTDEELLMEAKVSVPAPAHSPVKVLPPPPFPVTPPPAVPPVKPPVLPPPPVMLPPTKTPPIECTPLCVERCKLHSRKKLCWRACVTCCNRCKCVPPGTYGNREKCGKCYTNMTTRGGKPKCP
ncbi:gibberellin-regulated protein 14-like [Actinidia eriantha]|uniref:gibberellin-regulated protein 14-like n=1 Tax=Actinidia eriantha TaxID=165200 RepID=UPI0025906B49|nr:gibberellin-regulated protein 14-like [Actinidia eriantha]